ncbi:NMD3 family protein [Nitzschia inconspicua]|uniref:60S ribosomal export protein NMD3 n=1 Tax=Nitzschia inconspicua TaxID=303405 RepID=A0A9K3Q4K1_9STRA|nr:NMD3 family protein [Nitzschia inconspicua]
MPQILATTVNKIPCCLCGTLIVPNAANQCPSCLAQNFDLQSLLQGNDRDDPIIVYQCRQCRRFARTETHYEYCEPESPQLLSICLKHIQVLNKKGHTSNQLQVVDASWIWTEPHSMRLKLRVTVRTEIEHVTIQQRVPVVFQIHWKMCPNCNREFTNRTWHALVQLRQKRENTRKGLAALEMALGRNKEVRKNVLKIDATRQGLDFYFLTLSDAQQFAQFLQRLAPLKIKTSSKLVSTDVKNNTANMKHTLTCDMVPLCRDDLVLVHKESRSKLGGRLALVSKVASVIHLVDASPKRNCQLEVMEVTAEGYHKIGNAYTVLQTSERMIRFVVLDVELCDPSGEQALYEGPSSGVEKYALADVQLARESDLGSNDEVLSCVTHLGNLLQPGDVVWGYDLISTADNLNTTVNKASGSTSFMGATSVVGLEEVVNSNFVLQDVVLVKKISSKEQKDLTEAADAANASDMPGSSIDHDSGVETGRKKKNGSRGSKRKLRRQQKEDKKQRELEETAARMGFLDDLAEAQAQYAFGDDEEEDEEMDDEHFAQQLQNNPELAAELQAVEEELAQAYPEGKKGNADGDTNTKTGSIEDSM